MFTFIHAQGLECWKSDWQHGFNISKLLYPVHADLILHEGSTLHGYCQGLITFNASCKV